MASTHNKLPVTTGQLDTVCFYWDGLKESEEAQTLISKGKGRKLDAA